MPLLNFLFFAHGDARKGRPSSLGGFPKWLFDFNPSATAPIAVAVVFAPSVMFRVRPHPIIGMDLESQLWLEIRPAADVPAVTFVIAHDCG
jgi:hypothetical protein